MTMLSAARASSAKPPISNATLGMLIFVVTEVMFFAGLVSAHTIAKSNLPWDWPPPDQPRLPVASTAFNSLALLVSGFLVAVAGSRFRKDPRSALASLRASVLFGSAFVILQGSEWVALLREGLTLTSSSHGSFFYLIVGTHALHAVCALGFLSLVLVRLARGQLEASTFGAARVLWFFVVGVWPVLYWKVYL